MFKPDEIFFKKLESDGINTILQDVCHLDKRNAVEKDIMNSISISFTELKRNS